MRLMTLVFCDRALTKAPSSTRENRQALWSAVAEHASRILPTLVYARAQNNNHLLAEAAGLFTAGIYLPAHAQAGKWRQLGWEWLNRGLQQQITEFGSYVQNSTNYHRLMLQIVLVCGSSSACHRAHRYRRRLSNAGSSHTLVSSDRSGHWCQVRANDGAYLFPNCCAPGRLCRS